MQFFVDQALRTLPIQETSLYTLLPMAALPEAVVTGHHPARPLQQALPQQCMTAVFSGSAQVTCTIHHKNNGTLGQCSNGILQAIAP